MNEETILTSQFRCNGSDQYIQLINNILQIGENVDVNLGELNFDFEVFDDPNIMRDALREKNKINNKARMGSTPFTTHTAHTAPPVAKDPSTVKSAISKIRYVIYTPNAINPHKTPCDRAPCIANKTLIIIQSLLHFLINRQEL